MTSRPRLSIFIQLIVLAVFIASTVLEVVRSFSSLYFPNTWQLSLGLFLLFVIRFLPRGIGSLWIGRTGSARSAEKSRRTRRCCAPPASRSASVRWSPRVR